MTTGPVATTTSKTTITVSYPSGTTTNDLLLLVQVNALDKPPNTPTGWTQLADQATKTPQDLRFTVWWKLAGGETSVSLDVDTNTGTGTSAWVVRYRRPSGYPPNPTVATATVQQGLANASATLTPSPDVTTSQANATVVSIVAIRAANTLSLGTARGFTLQNATTSTPSQGLALGLADLLVVTSGSTPSSPTWSQSGTAAQWAWATIAFA